MPRVNEKLKKPFQYLIFAFNVSQTSLQGKRASTFNLFPPLGCSFFSPKFNEISGVFFLRTSQGQLY